MELWRWCNRTVRLARPVAVVLVLAAACADSDRPAATQRRTTTRVAAPSSSSIGAPATTFALPAGRVSLQLEDYAIKPAVIAVPTGDVALVVTNADRAPHNIAVLSTPRPVDALPTTDVRVDENDPTVSVLARSRTLASGERDEVTVRLLPGRYVVVCTVPHHYVRNRMVATLNVG